MKSNYLDMESKMKTILGVLSVASLALLSLNAGAQTLFTYTTSNTLTGATLSSPNSANWYGANGLTGSYFIDTALQNTNFLTPTTIRLMNITPKAGASGNNGPNNFSSNFSVTVNVTANAATTAFVFTGFNLTGTLNGTAQDTVAWTVPTTVKTLDVGGQLFTISVFKATDPDPVGGADGTLSARITSVPEPGAIAMLMGLGTTAVFGTLRFNRRRRNNS